MSQARIWEKMTVREVREALQTTRTVLVPEGVTEQHGYHLPLDTDSQTAFQVCRRAAEVTGSFVAPTMRYTFSGGELPGTINIDYHLVSLLVTEIIRAFCANGLRNVIIVPGHGGSENVRATREGAEMFYRQHPQYADRNVAIYRIGQHSPSSLACFADGDFHAGYHETSMMLYWAPEDVRAEIVLDKPEIVRRLRENPDNYQVFSSNVDNPEVIQRVNQDPAIEVGVMGDPARATAELGQRICEEAVGGLVELIRSLEGGA